MNCYECGNEIEGRVHRNISSKGAFCSMSCLQADLRERGIDE
jgi:hypothetical protein